MDDGSAVFGTPRRRKNAALLGLTGGKCFYCNHRVDDMTVTRDHFLPKAMGGRQRDNLVPCCLGCNRRKGDRLPTDRQIVRWLGARRPCRRAVVAILEAFPADRALNVLPALLEAVAALHPSVPLTRFRAMPPQGGPKETKEGEEA